VAEETWHAARLIPTSGINGAEEQERRATSALLAVLPAVKEFGRTLLGPLGAPAGHLETYIEVPFEMGDKTVYPDGLVRAKRGQRTWTALLEVKTGNNALKAEQLETYLDVAKREGFDAVVTISNEIPPAPGQHPTVVDRRKLRKVELHHLPWVQILSAAVLQKEHHGVADPDQAWILGELIRYLEHPRSGAMAFEDMGPSWVPVREAVRAGTLRSGDKGVPDVVARFDALLRYVGLRLGQRLGADVQLALSRRELNEPVLRSQALVQSLTSSGTLEGAIRIPDAAATLHITADLRANQIACHCDIDAPRQGRPRTRVNWLVRQLRSAPDALRLEAFVLHARGAGTAELLSAARGNPDLLIADASREIRGFRITQMSAMGTKRGNGRGSFIDSVVDAVDSFYGDVLQHLRAWSPSAPRLRDELEPPDVQPALVSTALSSQDEPDRSVPDARMQPSEGGEGVLDPAAIGVVDRPDDRRAQVRTVATRPRPEVGVVGGAASVVVDDES
jgi:hypothetical protein